MKITNVIATFMFAIMVLSAMVVPSMAAASAGTVTRSFSPSSVAPNGTVVVTLTPSPATLFDLPGYQATETIPSGFTFIVGSNTSAFALISGNVLTLTQIGNAAISYNVKASAATGTYTFNGAFKDDNQDTGTVTGATQVTVQAGAAGQFKVLDEKTPVGLAALAAGFTWNAINFEGFWYDLKDGLYSETLTLVQRTLGDERFAGKSRTIQDSDTFLGRGGLTYDTTKQLIRYKVSKEIPKQFPGSTGKVEQALDGPLGTKEYYTKLGWLGDVYVGLDGKAKKLSKLIIEQGTAASEKKTLTVGETWEVGGGWTLSAQSIDAKATPRQAWLILSYNGVKVDDKVVKAGAAGQPGEVYTYVEKSISGETDVPLFVTYIDNVFAGATTDMVQLRYTWAISKEITEVKTGDKFGVFKVSDASDNDIKTKLDSSITLNPDATVDLAGKLKFKVADDDDWLRFYPEVVYTQPGTYENRGTVFDEKAVPPLTPARSAGGNGWDALNFAGFWYDLKDGLFSETLSIVQANLGDERFAGKSRTIQDSDTFLGRGGLTYDTTKQLIRYKVSKEIPKQFPGSTGKVEQALDGPLGTKEYYTKLGWLGDVYVGLDGKAKKLSKLIIEQGTSASEKKTLTVGETWEVGGGWTLTANSIDAKATPRQAWLTLSYNGVKVDDKVVKAGAAGQPGEVYTYVEKSISGETDVPLFVTYIDNVFAGATTDMVQLRYTWAISKEITEVKTGDKFGVFKVSDASDNDIKTKLDSSITLNPDATVDLAGKLKFKVADDEDWLRFYPTVIYTIGEVTPTGTPVGTPVGTPKATPKVNVTANVTVTTPAATTPVTTTAATPKPAATTPKEPGFEAVFAIAGLLAVAYLVLRQRK